MTRRGFTLVEALAATMLLAVLAVACVPMLRASAESSHDPARAIDPGALGELADRVSVKPAEYGLAEDGPPVVVAWPEDLAHGASDATAAMHRVPAREEEPSRTANAPGISGGSGGSEGSGGGAWIVVECGPRSAVRWIAPEALPARSTRPAPRPRWGRAARRSRAVRRRGITLVETLVALAVTSMLAVAVVGWTVGSVQHAAGATRSARDAAAAEGIVRLLREELASGDEPKAGRESANGRREPRVSVEGGALVVRGRRDPDAPVRTYRLDTRRQELVAVDGVRGARAGSESTVATRVSEFALREVAVGRGRDTRRVLVVDVAVGEGDRLERRIPIP